MQHYRSGVSGDQSVRLWQYDVAGDFGVSVLEEITSEECAK